MTTINKNTANNKSEDLARKAKSNIKTASRNIKSSTNEIAEEVIDKTENSKDEAISLVESIRHLVSSYTDPDKIDEIKSDVYDKAKTLKDNVGHEVSTSVRKGKKKTIKTVRKNPLSSVAVAAGAGALLGYLIASKKK